MGDSYGNQQEAIELRKEAEAKVNKISEEERRDIIEKASSTPNEEAKKTMKTEEWLIATILCDRDSLKKMEKMPNYVIEQLRDYIRKRVKSDTLTLYDASILSHLCKAPWGPFELHDSANKSKL